MLRRNLTIASFIIASLLMTIGSAAAAPADRSAANDDYVVLDRLPKGLDLFDRYLPQRLLVILILGLLLHHLLPLMGNNRTSTLRVALHGVAGNGLGGPGAFPEGGHAHRVGLVPAGRQRAIVVRASSRRARSRPKRRRALPEREQRQLPADRRARRPRRGVS